MTTMVHKHDSRPTRSEGRRHRAAAAGSTDRKLRLLQKKQGDQLAIEVLEYQRLDGGRDIASAQNIFFANEAGIRLKQIRVRLDGGSVKLESGTLHFMKGRIEAVSKAGGITGLARGLATKLLTKQKVFRPQYTGHGEIYLEPTFGHFLLHDLNDETLIIDKGLYVCSESTIQVGVSMQKNVSSSLFGGEGLFQTKVSGHGVCVLSCPVPPDELICYELDDETLQVDGNFALMRSGEIKFSVRPSTKNAVGTLTSGEGLLQTFKGSGRVWIAPTQAIYDQLSQSTPVADLAVQQGSSHTDTTSG